MSEDTKEVKQEKKLTQEKTNVTKPRTSQEIKDAIGLRSEEGEFPKWATDKYGSTHKLRWIAPKNISESEAEIDYRGFEVVKNPKTGRIEKWKTLVLGMMPNDLAEERRLEKEKLKHQMEASFIEMLNSQKDRLQYELAHQGYGRPGAGMGKFEYSKTKN